MFREVCLLLLLVVGLGCTENGRVADRAATSEPITGRSSEEKSSEFPPATLLEARRGYQTQLQRQEREQEPLDVPPEDVFALVTFPAAPGPLAAYVSQPPQPNQRYPAMIWLTGGFPVGGIGASAWEPADPANDQSAKVYRERGMIMMYPTLRGTYGNPGVQEGFYGEVDDVIAAAEYLAKQPFVDPERIYLGGHSTGGTLALLVAEATDLFRGVVSFGPVEDPFFYGEDTLLHKRGIVRERLLRAPINFVGFVQSPTVVVEGTQGNVGSLAQLQAAAIDNEHMSFVMVPSMDHFSVLSPVNAILADRILNSPDERLKLSTADLVR